MYIEQKSVDTEGAGRVFLCGTSEQVTREAPSEERCIESLVLGVSSVMFLS